MDKAPEKQSFKPNPALKDLEILVGEWDTAGFHPGIPYPVRGHSSFGWLEGGAIFFWRSSYERDLPPSGIAFVGRDDAGANYCMLYYDQRGISRVYQMSLEGKIWRLWRDSPGFFQRMTGTFSDDLNSVSVHGEKSSDGSNWEQDLDLTYTRVG